MHISRYRIPFLILLAVLSGAVLLWSGYSGNSTDNTGITRFSGYTMGTEYTVQVAGLSLAFPRPSPGADGEAVSTAVAGLLAELDRGIFSTYADDSELSRFNRHETGLPFAASEHLLNALTLSQEVHASTGGAFDVSIGPLVNLWGFGPGSAPAGEHPPGAAEIKAALARVGIDRLVIDRDRSALGKSRDIYIDLSGIAKGYAVDRVAELLESRGIHDYFIEIGGELKASGYKPGNAAWTPAIEAPLAGPVQIYAVLSSRGETMALAGSGDYRNFFEIDGVRYSHEIDPATGWPVAHELTAAFVLDQSAARADAYATALMVLGLQRGRALAERAGIRTLLIYRDGDAGLDHYISPGFAPYIRRL